MLLQNFGDWRYKQPIVPSLWFLVRGETVNKFKSIITCFTDWTNFTYIQLYTYVLNIDRINKDDMIKQISII